MRKHSESPGRRVVTRPDATVGLWWQLPGAAALLLIAGGQPTLATLLILAPAAEEIVFRLGLQETLLRHAGTPAAARSANALTALAFAAAHLALRPGAWAALTVLPALACGHLYQRRRRVAPCIALHSIFNAGWLLLAAGHA